MKKRLLSLVFSVVLIATALFTTATVSNGFTPGDGPDYRGKDCTDNLSAACIIDYLMSKYKDGSTWTLGGECWGFAEKVNNFMGLVCETTDYEKLENTRENFLEKCTGVKAGTHIRFSNVDHFDGGWSGHSVALLGVSEEKMYWADNNYDRANTVHYYSGTLDDFYSMYGQYQYITRIVEVEKYKLYATSKISSRSNFQEGYIKLTWLRTTHTSAYRVLRSYSKEGPFKCIATTKSKTYLDKSVELGKKAYYRIESVRSNGNTTSGYVYNRLRLETPVIDVIGESNGGNRISWNKVENADRYKVYRTTDGGAEKLIKTTTALSYLDKKAASGSYHEYRVKAVYDANADGNSLYSNSVAAGNESLNVPQDFSGKTDDNNFVTLTWNPVAGADSYILYCCREENGVYWIEANTDETEYFDTVRKPGQQYYYKIAAYDSKTGRTSPLSKWMLI